MQTEQPNAEFAATEEEMRAVEVPTFDTPEELIAYIQGMANRPHDYGTCVYAMSLSAVAAFNYVARKLGVTGFQASCADLDILRHTRDFEWGQLVNFENLLYPQYLQSEYYPDAEALLKKHAVELGKRARVKLEENDATHPEVAAHWERLSAASPEAPEMLIRAEQVAEAANRG